MHLLDVQRVEHIGCAGRLARLAGNARQRIRGVRFGDCEYAAALQVVHQGSGRAQREGSPREW